MPDFLLPDLGEGLTEAEIVAWQVAGRATTSRWTRSWPRSRPPRPWSRSRCRSPAVVSALHAGRATPVRVGSPADQCRPRTTSPSGPRRSCRSRASSCPIRRCPGPRRPAARCSSATARVRPGVVGDPAPPTWPASDPRPPRCRRGGNSDVDDRDDQRVRSSAADRCASSRRWCASSPGTPASTCIPSRHRSGWLRAPRGRRAGDRRPRGARCDVAAQRARTAAGSRCGACAGPSRRSCPGPGGRSPRRRSGWTSTPPSLLAARAALNARRPGTAGEPARAARPLRRARPAARTPS